MKLQTGSKREIKRVSIGAAVCFALMELAFFVLSLLGVGTFDYTVVLGGAVGTVIAICNFIVLCLTIQRAAQAADKKQMKAHFQLSYNIRLMAQAGWVVAAFLLPWFNPLAAALPLLFPTLVIYFLQTRGVLVTPSERKNPAKPEDEEEQLDSFEV